MSMAVWTLLEDWKSSQISAVEVADLFEWYYCSLPSSCPRLNDLMPSDNPGHRQYGFYRCDLAQSQFLPVRQSKAPSTLSHRRDLNSVTAGQWSSINAEFPFLGLIPNTHGVDYECTFHSNMFSLHQVVQATLVTQHVSGVMPPHDSVVFLCKKTVAL
jgi:hypothetical protein